MRNAAQKCKNSSAHMHVAVRPEVIARTLRLPGDVLHGLPIFRASSFHRPAVGGLGSIQGLWSDSCVRGRSLEVERKMIERNMQIEQPSAALP